MSTSNSIVTLNVGGHIYTTTRSTLTRYPDSMLGAMFAGDMDTLQDDQGRYFVDRDGTLFRHVLNFLRTSQLVLPDDFKELSPLEIEADFYQIQPLIEALKQYKARREHKPCEVIFLTFDPPMSVSHVASTKEADDMVTGFRQTLLVEAEDDEKSVAILLGKIQENGFTVQSYGVAAGDGFYERTWVLVR